MALIVTFQDVIPIIKMRCIVIIELCCWPFDVAFLTRVWCAADFVYLSTMNPNIKYFIFLLLIKRCILTYLKINKLILTHSSKNVIVHVQAMADNSCICRNNKFTSLCSYTQINATHFFLLVPKIKSRLLFPSCVTWLVLKFCSKLL